MNNLPTFTTTPITSINENSVYTYNINASDADGQTVTFSTTTIPNWLSLTNNGSNNATLSGTPSDSNIGNNSVVLVATDSAGGETTQSFTIVVNGLPSFTSNAITSANEDSVYTYNITVTDPEGDNTTITAPTLPGWLALTDNGNNTATITGTPLQANVGNNSVTLRATDSSGGYEEQSFTIAVANVNDLPSFTSTAVTTVDEDSTYTYNITVSDEDGETATITAPTLPAWLTLTDNGNNTATLSGTPSDSNIGSNSVVLNAADATGSSTQSFTITVNGLPSFTSNAITSANEDSVYTYNITVTDPEGDNTTITAPTLPTWLALTDNGNNTATITGTPLQANVGNNSVTLRATDSSGGYKEQSFIIAVANVNDLPVFTSTPVTTANEDSAYSYTITASDEDGGNPTLTATTLPTWLTFSDNGHNATISGTPSDTDIGTHSVVINAADAIGSTTQSFNIVVNGIPTFSSSPTLTTDEDSVYTYNITVSDPEGDTTTITAPTLPGWLSLTDNNDNTATITGTPLQANVGDNSVTIRSTDSSGGYKEQSFTIAVANVNDAPTFTSTAVTSVNEDSTYTYNITVSDEDGQTATIAASTLPNWLTFTDNGNNTATLTGTPADANVGQHNTVLTATDPNGVVATQSFTITVNGLPEFSSSPTLTTNEDSVYTYNITVTDQDGDTTTITAPTLPAWLSFSDNGDNTATITGTPLQANVGNNSVTLRATDASGGYKEQSFTIAVVNVNDAPTFTSTAVTTVDEDSVYSYTITVSDEDGDTATITAPTLPTWLSITDNGDNTATLTGTPLNDHVGNNSVTIRASDSNGGTTDQSFVIVVSNTNDAPTITSTPTTTTNEDSVYTYNITVSDVDGENTTITAPTLPGWLSLTDNGNNTATITGTPLQANVGNNSVTIRATDGSGVSVDQSFTIVVTNVNDSPTFTSTPTTTTNEDSVYTYNITVSDEDGQTVTLTAPTLPGWLSLTDNGNNTGTITGTPLQANLGDNSVVIRATDPSGGTTDQSFTITVENVNDLPVFTSTPTTTTNEDSVYSYTVTVSDEDGQTVTLTAPTLPGWLSLTDNGNNTGTITGTPLHANLGDNNVTIRATDPSSGVTDHTFTISVSNVDDENTGTLSFTGTVQEGHELTADTSNLTDEDGATTYTYQWQVSDDDSSFTDITGATNATFSPVSGTHNNKYIRLTATSTDALGGTTDLTSSSALVEQTITSSSQAFALSDKIYTYNITVLNTINESFSFELGTAPSWVSLTDNGDNTATITGTPSGSDEGTNSITFTATGDTSGTHTQQYDVTVHSRQSRAAVFYISGKIEHMILFLTTLFDTNKLKRTINTANELHDGTDGATSGYITGSPSIINSGSGYAVNDNIHLNGAGGGHGAIVTVSSVNGSGGITGLTLNYGGMGYNSNETLTLATDGNGSNAEIQYSAGSDSVSIDDVLSSLSTLNTTNSEYVNDLAGSDDVDDFVTNIDNLAEITTNWTKIITRAIDSIALAFPDMPQSDGTTTLETNTSPSSRNKIALNCCDENTRNSIVMKIQTLRDFICRMHNCIEVYYRDMSWQRNSPLLYYIQDDLETIVSRVRNICENIHKFCMEAELLYTIFTLGVFLNEDNVANMKTARTDLISSFTTFITEITAFENSLLFMAR